MGKALYHTRLENGSFVSVTEGEHHDGRPSLTVTYEDATRSDSLVGETFHYPVGTSSSILYRDARMYMQLYLCKLELSMLKALHKETNNEM